MMEEKSYFISNDSKNEGSVSEVKSGGMKWIGSVGLIGVTMPYLRYTRIFSTPRSSPLPFQGLLDISKDIIHMFQSDAQANRRVKHVHVLLLLITE